MPVNPKAKVVLEAERRGQAAFKGFEADLAKIAKQAAVAGAALAAAIGAGLAIVTKEAFASQDALAKFADKVGDSTQNIQAFRTQAQLSGIDISVVDKTLTEATKRLGEFNATGGGTAALWFKRLNLDTKELAALKPTELFQRYAEAVRGLSDRGQQLSAISALAGDRQGDLIQLVDQGRGAFEDAVEQVERYSLALNRVDAAKVEAANDAMFMVRQRTMGLGNLIAAELAPVITDLANRLLGVSDNADEMRERIRGAIDAIASAAGVAADIFHGWHLTFALAEVSILKIEARMDAWMQGYEDSGFYDQMRDWTRALMPDLVDQMEELRVHSDDYRASLQASTAAAEANLAELVAAERPSQAIAAALEAARANAQRLGEQVARAREEIQASTFSPDSTAADDLAREAAEKLAARAREQMERSLEQVRQFTLTREEVEIEAHARRLEVLRSSFEAEMIDKERFDQLSIELAERTQARLTEITEKGLSDREKFQQLSSTAQTQHVLGELVNMTAGIAQHSKTAFKVNQAAAIANAVVNTAQAVTKALAAYPPPLSFAMAAAQAAAGLVQIKAIKSATFGGGTTPSVAGSVPVHEGQPVSSSPQGQSQQTAARAPLIVHVTVQGGLADRETGIVIGETLRELIDNDDFEIMDKDSNQAAKIRGIG